MPKQAEKDRKMPSTVSLTAKDLLVSSTKGLPHTRAAAQTPVAVSGKYEREPASLATIVGKLPTLVIPVINRYPNREPVGNDVLLDVARILAASFYSHTRIGIRARELKAQLVSIDTDRDGWFCSTCPATGLTFLVRDATGKLDHARKLVESLYHRDAPYAGAAGMRTSETTVPSWIF